MNTSKILAQTHHRPWPLPSKRWKYYQEWNNAIFLHWKVDLDVIRPFVPSDLEIDIFEDNAWISVVAFTMESVTMRNIPPFNPISVFHELNLRTYVRYKGKAGVYFLSIDAANKVSTWLAKNMTHLPYRYADIERDMGSFKLNSNTKKSSFECDITPGESVTEITEQDAWLVERYGLFQDYNNKIMSFDIHHTPWPLQSLKINRLNIDYPRFNSLVSGYPDKMHYSPGVQVVCWD